MSAGWKYSGWSCLEATGKVNPHSGIFKEFGVMHPLFRTVEGRAALRKVNECDIHYVSAFSSPMDLICEMPDMLPDSDATSPRDGLLQPTVLPVQVQAELY